MPIGNGRLTKTPKRILGAFVLISCLCALACGTSEIIVSLNIAAAATSAASTTIASVNGIDSELQAQITTYLGAISTGLTTAATDLRSGSITNTQIASIVTVLAATVSPALPDSVPESVKTTLTTVSPAVKSFVDLLQKQQTSTAMNNSSGKVTYYRVTLSRKDRSLVDESLQYLVQAHAALAQVIR